LAVALAEAAIQSGQAAYFMTAHDLITDLGLAYRKAGRTGGCASISRPKF
jgi:DNA replication protein DnaC